MTMSLGIDFGTTRTVVALGIDGRYVLAHFDVDGEYHDFVPSMVALHDGERHYGWDAAHLLRSGQAQAALRSIKRLLADTPPDAHLEELGGVCVLDLLAEFLAALRAALATSNLAEHLDFDQPLCATVALPANSTTQQRYTTLEAFRRAGFCVELVLNEPTAAAIEFAHQDRSTLSPRSPKRYMVVYDLGGGTFDTSAISLQGQRFELLDSEGIARLGGDDFDEVIYDGCLEATERSPQSISALLRERLLELCRDAKEALRPQSKKLLIDLGEVIDGAEPVGLDVKELFERCQPLMDRTLALIDRLFDGLIRFGIDPESVRELGGLYLVGGGVSFPIVSRTLRERYGRKLKLAPQPHASTAVGLAIAGDPAAGVHVREAVTRHFGVWREVEGGAQKRFDPIFSKGDRSGEDGVLEVKRAYRAVHNLGHLRFLECSDLDPDGQPQGDLMPWGALLFPYARELQGADGLDAVEVVPLSGAAPEIEERYRYHRDGRVSVEVRDLGTGFVVERWVGSF